MHFQKSQGLLVVAYQGAPLLDARGPDLDVVEIDVGNAIPVAFSGLRRVLTELETIAPEAVREARAHAQAEMAFLFPQIPSDVDALFHLADAPNQRRLFRESEQVYRVLNASAGIILAALAATNRPLVLRNVGACDLPTLRGLMHAVELSRMSGGHGTLHLGDLGTRAAHAPASFQATRAAQLVRLLDRMRAVPAASAATPGVYDRVWAGEPSLEGRYLASALDASESAETRIVAAVLSLRTTFFSTSYEGTRLAADTGIATLAARANDLDPAALERAWDALDDGAFDVPMVEIDRSCLRAPGDLDALFRLHIAITQSFCFQPSDALLTLERALAGAVSREMRSDLHMYRAVIKTKRLGDVPEAQIEIERGLAAVASETSPEARVREAWLRNLYALTYFQQNDLVQAEEQEARAIAAVDGVDGDSATHLKTNLISNFSVLFEAKGDLDTAIGIWRGFEALNAKIGSARADKVFHNRLGALLHQKGERAEAIAELEQAYGFAEQTGDRFHAETIGANLGRILLDGSADDRRAAERWYACAAANALGAGDPVQLAADLAGGAIAAGNSDFDGAREALACNSTYDLAKSGLRVALEARDPAGVRAALAKTKTKLSRPFDLVNV